MSVKSENINVIYTYSKLLVLLPGETLDPMSPTGKTGSVLHQKAGTGFTVTVLGVSDKNTKVDSVNTSVELSSNHPAFLPITTDLTNGEVQIPVTLNQADPLGWTFVAKDLNRRVYNYKFVFISDIQMKKI